MDLRNRVIISGGKYQFSSIPVFNETIILAFTNQKNIKLGYFCYRSFDEKSSEVSLSISTSPESENVQVDVSNMDIGHTLLVRLVALWQSLSYNQSRTTTNADSARESKVRLGLRSVCFSINYEENFLVPCQAFIHDFCTAHGNLLQVNIKELFLCFGPINHLASGGNKVDVGHLKDFSIDCSVMGFVGYSKLPLCVMPDLEAYLLNQVINISLDRIDFGFHPSQLSICETIAAMIKTQFDAAMDEYRLLILAEHVDSLRADSSKDSDRISDVELALSTNRISFSLLGRMPTSASSYFEITNANVLFSGSTTETRWSKLSVFLVRREAFDETGSYSPSSMSDSYSKVAGEFSNSKKFFTPRESLSRGTSSSELQYAASSGMSRYYSVASSSDLVEDQVPPYAGM